MVKLPFSRNKSDDSVPQEVQEYYQAERRERAGVAWLLAIVTLVVTLALAVALFFGGRWVYRALFDNNDDETSQVEQDVQENESVDDSAPADDRTDDDDRAPVELPDGLGGDDEADDSDEAPSTDGDGPERTPTTGPTELPSTGPSSNL